MASGNLIYKDTDSNLYYAAIKGTDISDGTKIASDVEYLKVAENGDYVYYMKDCEDSEGSLYGYKIGDSEPKKVGSDIGCYSSSYYSYGYYQISSSGSTVYYIKDVESVKDTYTDYGTLMKWNYSSGESEKISSDVTEVSLSSALSSSEINENGFMFLKYASVDSESNIGQLEI